jgi:hypothetical protein
MAIVHSIMNFQNKYKDERNPLLQPVVASGIALATEAAPKITARKVFIFLNAFLFPLVFS